MAAKHLQVLDRAVLADDSLELHRPLNAGGLGQRRIGRLDPMNQQAFHHDRNPLRRANGGSDGDDRPVGWAEDGVEDSVRIPNWSGCASAGGQADSKRHYSVVVDCGNSAGDTVWGVEGSTNEITSGE